MVERLDLSAKTYVSKILEDGTTITARKIETQRPKPQGTASHEAAHAVAAGEIVYATIIPSGDALGTTQPVKMTAAAAAAPDALGHSGTGWDMFLTEHMLGVDPGTARSAARSALSGRYEEIEEVATLLQERKTIGQRDMKEARQNIKDRTNGIFEAEVEILKPGENVITFPTRTLGGEIKIPNSTLLPTAAKASENIIPFPAKSAADEVKISAEPAPLSKTA